MARYILTRLLQTVLTAFDTMLAQHAARHGVRASDPADAVGELAEGLPVSRPAVSQHLKVLRCDGLVIDLRRWPLTRTAPLTVEVTSTMGESEIAEPPTPFPLEIVRDGDFGRRGRIVVPMQNLTTSLSRAVRTSGANVLRGEITVSLAIKEPHRAAERDRSRFRVGGDRRLDFERGGNLVTILEQLESQFAPLLCEPEFERQLRRETTQAQIGQAPEIVHCLE